MAIPTGKSTTLEARLSAARDDLARLIHAGEGGVEQVREHYPDVWSDDDAALELVVTEFVARQPQARDDWYRRFPQWRERLERLFDLQELFAHSDTLPGLGQSTNPTDLDHPPGYDLLEEVGRGASAVVYRARQRSLNRIVAIKLLAAPNWASHADGDQLRREAELAARLVHPNIVSVYEVGEWADRPFLSMEYVEGRGLDAGAECDPAAAAAIVETLARAMAYAHSQGVVHRDLKPANVLVGGTREPGAGTWNGEDFGAFRFPAPDSRFPLIKIADFGLAVGMDSARSIGQTATIAGTPCYMAPEQAEGRKADIGPRTDVYALGAILYELLTGRPPFRGGCVVETMDLVRTSEPVPPRTIQPQAPRDLETICLKCLSKSPAQRYVSAGALADDVRRFLDGRPIVARPVSPLERAVKWVKRRPAIAALSFALLAALTAGIVLQTARRRDSELARVRERQLHHDAQKQLAGKVTASARAVWNAGLVADARRTLMECPEEFRDDEWRTLHPLCFAEIAHRAVPEVTGSILAVSPDGRRIAHVQRGVGMPIRIIDAASGEPIDSVDLGAIPYLVEFTTDGDGLVAVASFSTKTPNRIQAINRTADPSTLLRPVDLSLRFSVYDLARKAMVRQWSSPEHPMAAISPSGRRIAAGHGDRLRIWDTGTGEQVVELPGPFAVGRYAVAWDGRDEVLAVRLKSEIQVWNVDKREMVRAIKVAAFETTGLEKSMPIFGNFVDPVFLRPDGRAVFAAPAPERTGTMPSFRPVVAWDANNGNEAWRITSKGLTTRIQISPDGRRLAVALDNNIELYDAHAGKLMATLRGHSASLSAMRFSADGRRLYSLSSDKTIRTWDVSPWSD